MTDQHLSNRTPAEEALHYLETVIIPNMALITDKEQKAKVVAEYKKALEAVHKD